MILKEVEISGYKQIKNAKIKMDKFNVLVGKNGTGKSSVLRALDLFFNEMKSIDVKIIENPDGPKEGGDFKEIFPVRDASIIWKNKPGSAMITCLFSNFDISRIFPAVPFEIRSLKGNNEIINKLEDMLTVRKEYIIQDNRCTIQLSEIKLGEHTMLKREVGGKLSFITFRDPPPGMPSNIPAAIIKEIGYFLLIPARRRLEEEGNVHVPGPDGQGIPSAMLRYEKEPGVGKRGTYKRIVNESTMLMPASDYITSMTDNKNRKELYFGDYRSSSSADGDKEMFHLCFHLLDSDAKFIGIEEPEIHLHPSLQKDCFNYLMEKSNDKQIILTTHSPAIASRTPIENLRFVKSTKIGNDLETKIVNEIKDSHISMIISDLGIQHSDYFENDAIIFVEGISDCLVFTDFWNKLQKKKKVLFLDTEGFTNMDYYANIRVIRSNKISVGCFVIFDGDTLIKPKKNKMREEVVKRIKLDKDHVKTCSEQSLESYLLVPRAIKVVTGLNVTKIENILNKMKNNKNKAEVLDIIFREAGYPKYNKKEDAIKIAIHIKPKEIHKDIVKTMEEIAECID